MQLIYFSSSKLAHKILKHRFMPPQIQRGISLIVLPLPSERAGERLLRGCVQAVMVYAFGCVMMLSFSLSSIIIPIFLSTFAG